MAQITDRDWLWIAGEFYLAGFLLGTWSLLRGGKPSNVAMYGIIVSGYVVQLVGLYIRGMAVGGCPLWTSRTCGDTAPRVGLGGGGTPASIQVGWRVSQ